MQRSGFTLIELLVVVAIAATMAVAGFSYLGGYRTEQNLKLTSSEVLSAVKNTQQLSKSQQGGSRWGIHFSNSTSTQSYAVFSGTSFATGTVSRTYSLGRNVKFGNPGTSSTIDILFSPSTGNPAQNQIISLNSGRTDGFVNDIIMNTLGQITSKFDTGLVGYWHLDENALSTVYDASGMGHNGVVSSSPSWVSGSNCKNGSCLSFNGDNRIVLGSNFADNMPAIAVTAWVYSASGGYALGFAAKDDLGSYRSWYFGMNDSTSFKAALWTTTGRTDISMAGFNLNSWNHVAFTYDGANMYLYLNGVQSAPTPKTGMILSNPSTPVTIGSLVNQYLFFGKLDEIRIYNRALSATEIADIYNSTR